MQLVGEMMKTYFLFLLGILLFFSCGGSSSETSKKTMISVNGLEGILRLQINNGEMINLEKDGEFEFKTSLDPEENYKVKVIDQPCEQRCTIDKPTGKVSSNSTIVLSVTCDKKSWDYPTSISDFVSFTNFNVESSAVDMNEYGDILLAWTQSDGKVYKKEFINGSWLNPLDIFDFINSPQGLASGISAAIDTNENANIGWVQNSGELNYDQVYLARKLDDIWVSPSLNHPISIPHSNAYYSPDPGTVIKINKHGDGIIVWIQEGEKDENVDELYVAELKNGTWSLPKLLNSGAIVQGSPQFDVAFNDNGDVIVNWVNFWGGGVYVAEKINGEWKIPKQVNIPGGFYRSRVAMNNLGEAIVVWDGHADGDISDGKLFKSERSSNFEWTVPKDKNDYITVNNEYSGYADVAINDEGYSIIVWRDLASDKNYYNFKLEGYKGDWKLSDKKKISVGDYYAERPFVEVDNQNNAIILWRQRSTENWSDNHLFKAESHDIKNSKWDYPQSISDHISPGSSTVYKYAMVEKNCRSVVAWTQLDAQEKNYQLFLSIYH